MSKPILYIKPQCPWCKDALRYFKEAGIELQIKDVLEDAQAMTDMVTLSHQNLTPTFVFNDCVIADFSVEEFVAEIEKFPEHKARLNF